MEVVFQRIGKDGKPEEGAISVLDFEQGGVVFGDATGDFPEQERRFGITVVHLPYFEYSRRVTFFFPDDPDAEKVTVDVPARTPTVVGEKKIVEPKSAGQRIAEAWQRGRRGELLAAKDPAKIIPLAALAGGILATILVFRGPEGPGGK